MKTQQIGPWRASKMNLPTTRLTQPCGRRWTGWPALTYRVLGYICMVMLISAPGLLTLMIFNKATRRVGNRISALEVTWCP